MILFVYNDMDDPYYDAWYLLVHTYIYAYVIFFVYFLTQFHHGLLRYIDSSRSNKVVYTLLPTLWEEALLLPAARRTQNHSIEFADVAEVLTQYLDWVFQAK